MKKTLLALLLSVAMVVTYAASAIPFVLAVEGEEAPTVPDDSEYGKYTGTYLNLDFDSVDDLTGATIENGVNGGFQNAIEDGVLKVYATQSHTFTSAQKRKFTIPVSGVNVDTTKPFTVSMRFKTSNHENIGIWYGSDLVSSHNGGNPNNGWGQIMDNAATDTFALAQFSAYSVGTLNKKLTDGDFHTLDILYTPVSGGFDVALYIDGSFFSVSSTAKEKVLSNQTFDPTNFTELYFEFGTHTAAYTHDAENPLTFELDYFRIGDAAALYGKYAGTYFDLTFDAADTAYAGLTLAAGSTAQMTVADGYATVTGASSTPTNAQVLYTPAGITVDPTQPISISYRYKVVGTAPTNVEFMFPGNTFITYGANVNSVVSGIHGGWPSFGYTGKYLSVSNNPGMPNLLDGEFHTIDMLYTPIVDEDETNNDKRNAQLYIDGQLIFDTAVGAQDEELDIYDEIRNTVAQMSFANTETTLSNVAIMHRNLTSEQTIVYDYVRLGNGTDFHICSHNLTEHPYQDSNCTETGNKPYYECTCGLLYTDTTATVTTTLEAMTIVEKGHTEADEWSSNVNGHWHDCTVCGKPADALATHTDADSNDACDTCTAELTYVYTAAIKATDITVLPVTSVTRGDMVYITITVGGNTVKDITAFSAGEVVLNFDSNYLTFNKVSSTLGGADVEVNGNVLKLADHGNEKTLTDEGTIVYTLAFNTKSETDTTPTANVTLVEARFNTEASAKEDNLILAKFGTASVDVLINKPTYDVNLGENLSADVEEVTEGDDLTFTLTGDYLTHYSNYNITITVTPEENATLANNDNGTYTLKDVMGEVSVSMSATPKNYNLSGSFTDNVATEEANKETLADVLLDPAGSFPAQLTYGTDFTFKVKADLASTDVPGYAYTVTVKINGGAWLKRNPTSTDENGINTYTIEGSEIVGDVSIVITKVVDAVDYLSLGITGVDVYVKPGQDANNIAPGGSITIVFNPKDGYKYTVTYSSGEEIINQPLTFDANKEYTFTNVTANIQVNVTKNVDVVVRVEDYITLDDLKMYLILVTNTPEEGETKMSTAFAGSTYTYNGVDMYWSDKYGAYCYLVIENEAKPTVEAVKALINVNGDAAATAVSYEMDVNKSGTIDANDAQLVWNMYNVRYNSFDDVTVEKFLRADVNEVIGVDTTDSAAIISYIIRN